MRVRAAALDMAAGMSPSGREERHCLQHLRPAGPAVLLITPCEETDDWIDRWEARGILIRIHRDRHKVLNQKRNEPGGPLGERRG